MRQLALPPLGLAALVTLSGCAPTTQPVVNASAEAEPARAGRTAPLKIAQLLGLFGRQVIETLGPPVLRKTENGGEVWLYAHANGCSLDIVLFPKAQQLAVLHATTQTPPAMTEAACLEAISVGAR